MLQTIKTAISDTFVQRFLPRGLFYFITWKYIDIYNE